MRRKQMVCFAEEGSRLNQKRTPESQKHEYKCKLKYKYKYMYFLFFFYFHDYQVWLHRLQPKVIDLLMLSKLLTCSCTALQLIMNLSLPGAHYVQFSISFTTQTTFYLKPILHFFSRGLVCHCVILTTGSILISSKEGRIHGL